jgi:aspartyl-tRNA(Asn)/glutamyl-tRNA(Gln) amidotransferase subunit C
MPETITEKDVEYVAGLARLELDAGDTKRFRQQLSSILDYIERLKEVDTEDTPPTTHVLPSMKNVFREDEPGESLAPDQALMNAPVRKGDFFAVPKILKDA